MVAECPRCGNQLWQVILDDPARKLDQCPKCGNTLSTSTPREAEWISELEGTQSAAEQDQTSGQEEKGFSTREQEEVHRRMLRSHGYILDLDSQGMRLTSISTGRSNPAANLSPYDVVRLASELEGGVVPVEERIKCPACEAHILPTDKICSWCSAPLA